MNDISEIPEHVLVQIKNWLQPWFQIAGSSGVRQVTSKDGTVRVLRGRGPVVDLHVTSRSVLDTTDGVTSVNPTTQLVIGTGLALSEPSPGVAQVDDVDDPALRFDTEPQSGNWLDIETTGSDAHGHGMHFNSGNGGAVIEAAGGSGIIDVETNVTIRGKSPAPGPQAELDIGTAAGAYIEALVDGFTITGTFEVIGHAATRAFIVQNGGGADNIGFFNIGPVGQQTVTGSRGGNAALASLLTALAAYGLIVDSTTP